MLPESSERCVCADTTDRDHAGLSPAGHADNPHAKRRHADAREAGRHTPQTLYVHVGLPKAASSYLHGHVFPDLMGGRYVMPGARNAKDPAYRFRRNRFGVRRFSDAFQKQPEFWQLHGESFLHRYLAPLEDAGRLPRSVLISDEAITRLNHFGIRLMPEAFRAEQLCANLDGLRACARKLGFERVRLLLMTRRQDTLLAASYVQLSRKIPGASQADFERRVKSLLARPRLAGEAPFYGMDYGRLHDCFAASVGADNVCILPIERIGADFDGFVGDMRRFLELDADQVDLSQAPTNTRARGGNRWGLRPLLAFKSPRGNFEITVPRWLTGRAAEIELTPALESAIRAHYDEENRRLARNIEQNLGVYGYCD